MPDIRWIEGLHQVVEAKEGVPIRQNSKTAASITYQNFFLIYPKLSGMTGTAKISEVEFEKFIIYLSKKYQQRDRICKKTYQILFIKIV